MNEPENAGFEAVAETRDDNIVSTIEDESPEPKAKDAEVVQEVEKDEPQDGEKPKEKLGGFTKKLMAKDARIAELEAKLAGNEPKTVETPSDKPKLDDFETYDQYTEALTDWKFDQRAKEQESKSREEALRNEAKKRMETYGAKADEFAKDNPDFDEVVSESDAFTPIMVQAIQDSDLGPQVAYYLAKNPDEAEKLKGLGVVAMNRALGRIEAKLETNEAKPAVRTTNAPPPIKPVSRSASTTVDPYNSEMSADEYAKWRRQRKS